MPSDERASSASTAISLFHFANHRSMRIGNGARCHKNVIVATGSWPPWLPPRALHGWGLRNLRFSFLLPGTSGH